MRFLVWQLDSYKSLLAVCLAVWMSPLLGAQDTKIVEAVLSPDGSKIAVVTVDDIDLDNFIYETAIRDYSPQTETWGEPRVIGTGYSVWHPRWSPDGAKLTITSQGLDWFNRDVLVINADGTGEMNLTSQRTGSDGWSSWSPDGATIAFFSSQDADSQTHELWFMNADGSSPVRAGGFFQPWSTAEVWLDAETLSLSQNGTDYIAKVDGSIVPELTAVPPAEDAWPPPSVVLATLVPRRSKLAPLSLGSVFTLGIATGQQLTPTIGQDGKISTVALGACVKINGVLSPLLAVTFSQINFQVPAETPTGPNQLTVLTECDTASPKTLYTATVEMERASPGIFNGSQSVAARFQDGTPVAPAGAVVDEAGRSSRPARPGEIVSIYGTGWGPTIAPIQTGEVVAGANPLLPEANPQVLFGGVSLPSENVLYMGAAPGAAGLYQLNLVMPSTPAEVGDPEIRLSVYGKLSAPGTRIPVEAP